MSLEEKYRELFARGKKVLHGSAPALMNSLRQSALERFFESADFNDEKYRQISPLTALYPANDDLENIPPWRKTLRFRPIEGVRTVVVKNGQIVSDDCSFVRNYKITGLRQFIEQHRDIAKDYFANLTNKYETPLTALNTAFCNDGFVIYLPKTVQTFRPVYIYNITTVGFANYHNMIIAEKDTSVNICIRNIVNAPNNAIFNGVTEIFADSKSNVALTQLNDGYYANLYNSFLCRQAASSKTALCSVTFSGRQVINSFNMRLEGKYSETRLLGASFPSQGQQISHLSTVEHSGAGATSDQLFRNILSDNGIGVFNGRIHVGPRAAETVATQRNDNLLLSDDAKMFTKPDLVIDNDDVKCSHGATVGQPDSDALFYCRARGIAEHDARRLLAKAFITELLKKLNCKFASEHTAELIERWLDSYHY
ncbi:MAG: Fe-S cluster assembly protein SufD [Bacteroidales bacterium]|jgi:Fe-S cluster assembly protein SufD|nr:Fe-S cluster assembly protein SufD [Bacteroidales bacterium]